jgi:hypothetical protein
MPHRPLRGLLHPTKKTPPPFVPFPLMAGSGGRLFSSDRKGRRATPPAQFAMSDYARGCAWLPGQARMVNFSEVLRFCLTAMGLSRELVMGPGDAAADATAPASPKLPEPVPQQDLPILPQA